MPALLGVSGILITKEVVMKRSVKMVMVVMSVAVLILMAFSAMAANSEKKAPSPKQQAQYEKMRTCNAEAKAKALKGDERKAFMSDCLKSKSDGTAQSVAEAKASAKKK